MSICTGVLKIISSLYECLSLTHLTFAVKHTWTLECDLNVSSKHPGSGLHGVQAYAYCVWRISPTLVLSGDDISRLTTSTRTQHPMIHSCYVFISDEKKHTCQELLPCFNGRMREGWGGVRWVGVPGVEKDKGYRYKCFPRITVLNPSDGYAFACSKCCCRMLAKSVTIVSVRQWTIACPWWCCCNKL